MINRIRNKSFCLYNIWVRTVYMEYVYINTHMHVYISEKYATFIY